MAEITRIFGDQDDRTVAQLRTCLEQEDDAKGVLCADGHLGYNQPIGAVVAYREHISPAGVGYDIGCGNKAVRTDITGADLRQRDLAGLMDSIVARVSFGVGRSNKEPVADHPVLDRIRSAALPQQRKLYDTAAQQLGTVGAGNHYVDLFTDEADRVWVGVHFGSRGFGHKTASGFMALAQGRRWEDGAKQGEMEAPPALLVVDSEAGQAYIEAMQLAGEYAYAGRDWVVHKVLEILGARATLDVHNHHNFAWRETHFGRSWWVVRKGATPAFPGQAGFVGSTMAEPSVILEGAEHPDAEAAMYSTVHGAGRAMSRNQAAGRIGKVWECTERDCGHYVPAREYAAELKRRGVSQHERFTTCTVHPGGRMRKATRRLREGAIDFDRVKADMRSRGIELRGGAADEAPAAYKRLDTVLAEHGPTVRVRHKLTPIGVAMAGPHVYDPFKD
jgi:tRNA-splicing ligase RtcB